MTTDLPTSGPDDDVRILALRDAPERLEEAAEFFSTKWGIARVVYEDSMAHSFADATAAPLPRWYLLLRGERVIGSYGLIANDFASRQDLWPWLCALYVESDERGHAYGALLLAHGRSEAARLGFSNVYLATDHGGYYEKYGWRFLGTCYGPGGEPSRLYGIPSVDRPVRPVTLETDRLRLRPYRDDDFEAVHRYAGSFDNLRMTAWGPNTEQETRGFLRRAQAQLLQVPRTDFNFAVVRKDTGDLIGGVGITPDASRSEAETGWTLRLDQHRNGFATEAARELLRFGFGTLGLHRVWATCRADNTGSYRVMERIGMRREALQLQSRPGRPCDPLPWYDGLQYAILRDEWRPMIRFESDGHVFNFRVAGILFHAGRVLVHRGLHDDFYAFPGGRVEPGEDTATTVVREFQEEIGLVVDVVRLHWVNENFFTHEGHRFHELGFYYLLQAREDAAVPSDALFHSTELGPDGRPHLEFRWVEVENIGNVPLYPMFAKERLGNLPRSVEHVVERE